MGANSSELVASEKDCAAAIGDKLKAFDSAIYDDMPTFLLKLIAEFVNCVDSEILDCNFHLQIHALCPEPRPAWRLLYRATRDGFYEDTYSKHALETKEETVTVRKSGTMGVVWYLSKATRMEEVFAAEIEVFAVG